MTIKAKIGAAPKAAAKEPKAKPAQPAAKKQASGPQLRVTQTTGTIARKWDQQATLIGLGLNKRHRSRLLPDTPEVRGMIRKVSHLVKVEQA